jgi:hypothetical protein
LICAGIVIEMNESENLREPVSNDNQASRDAQPDQLNKPASKIISLTLPSSSTDFSRANNQEFKVHIEITTQFLQPPFGTTYTITTPSIITQILRPAHLSHLHKWAAYDMDSALKKIYEIIELDIAHNMIAVISKRWTANALSADLTAPIRIRGSNSLVHGMILIWMEESESEDKPGAVTLSIGRKLSTHIKVINSVKWDGNAAEEKLMDVAGKWMAGV